MDRRPVAAMMFLVLLLAGMQQAAAQSFDCRRAVTPDEIAICSNPLLGELDEIMADFYRRLRHYTKNYDNAMGLQAQLRDEARTFLRLRATCGTDEQCLEQAYRARIHQLLQHWNRAME